MTRKTTSVRTDFRRQRIDIEQVEDQLERVERLASTLEVGLDWKPSGRCTHCEDGRLVRKHGVLQCTSCSYRGE